MIKFIKRFGRVIKMNIKADKAQESFNNSKKLLGDLIKSKKDLPKSHSTQFIRDRFEKNLRDQELSTFSKMKVVERLRRGF